MSRQRKGATALVLLGGAACMGLFPAWYISRKGRRNLFASDDALTGTQVQRGPFMNSGSRDAGPDPAWDRSTHTWQGETALDKLARREAAARRGED